jgi:PleD family two-component response regulator
MNNPTDVSVLVYSLSASIGRTLRMAMRGVGIRSVHLAISRQENLEGFLSAEPQSLAIYVDGPEANDDGLELIRFVRRSEDSPNRRIPIVAISPRRDIITVNAVLNAGGHEYVVFPAAGDTLLKKVTAARQSMRPFIEQPGYVGPCRRRRNNPTYSGPERRVAAQIPAAV